MARKLTLILTKADRISLERLLIYGADWRPRQRAKTLILLDDGFTTQEVAVAVDVDAKTVDTTRREWLNSGLASLADKARSGAPRKITCAQVEKIVEFAMAEPLSAKALLAKHLENGGAKVHVNTLTQALKASGIVWKRTRHSLKKKRCEIAFRAAQAEIEGLRSQAAAGKIVLAYVDEAGFSQVHPNRSAWTPTGGRHLIQAIRGKRLNVLGALISTSKLFSAKLWNTTKSDAFAGFLCLLYKHVGTAFTVILDNASIHRAKEVKPFIKYLEQQGVKFYFLPPYSPELNRIERLWHKIKYTWMVPKQRDAQALE